MFTKKDINLSQQNVFLSSYVYLSLSGTGYFASPEFLYKGYNNIQHTQQNQSGLLMQQWMVILYHKYLYT